MKFKMGKQIGLSKTGDFLGLAASWLLFISFFPHAVTAPALYLIWLLLSSFLAIMLLGTVGYFEHHIPRPELSGIVNLLFAVPLSALSAKWFMALTSHIPPVRYSEVLAASIGVALVFEVAQLFVFKIHRIFGGKWTLVAVLQPAEFEELVAQVKESRAAWWIRLLSFDDMQKRGLTLQGDETMVISRQSVRHMKEHPELLQAHLRGQPIVDIKQLLSEFRGRVSIPHADAWTYLLSSTFKSYLIRFYFYLKEFVEVVLAIILSIVLLPLLVALSIGVLITKGRPIFYRQERLGYRGKPFFLYKFRTMVQTAEKDGPKWATEDDPRISPFGKWLRKTRMDELPQLFNVIRGDLSFVGPRPERPEFYEVLNKSIPLFPLRLLVRPGITGWAQVRQGYAASVEECRLKLEYDLYYVQHMSPQMDLRVVLHTIAMMIRGNSGR